MRHFSLDSCAAFPAAWASLDLGGAQLLISPEAPPQGKHQPTKEHQGYPGDELLPGLSQGRGQTAYYMDEVRGLFRPVFLIRLSFFRSQLYCKQLRVTCVISNLHKLFV